MPDQVRFRLLIVSGFCLSLACLYLFAGRTRTSLQVLPELERPKLQQPALIPNAGLVAELKDFDFGTVAETSAFPWQLRLTNPTAAAITITEFKPLCSCQFDSRGLTIHAGETVTIPIQFDLTPRVPERASSVREHGWPFIPQITGHPGRHPGWWIRGISTR